MATKSESAALELARKLPDIIASTRGDLSNMPFFVRPMVKRGFAKRTGRNMDAWVFAAQQLAARLENGAADVLSADAALIADLGRLAEHYRTAPERAARAMSKRPVALAKVRTLSAEREELVRALMAALEAR